MLAEWVGHEDSLHGFKIRFICASSAQVSLYSKAFSNEAHLGLVPFPVDSGQFSFASHIRAETRKRLQIPKKELVLIYAGRFSPEKNVAALVQALLHILRAYSIPHRILLVGNFNDLGSIGPLGLPMNSYYPWLNQVSDDSVTLIPHQCAADLRDLYCAADLFVSLSTASSEIFGLAPAEALCCGLPLAVTEWAGYKDFSSDDGAIWKFPVTLSTRGPVPTAVIAQDFLNNVYLCRNDSEVRTARAKGFANKYGVVAVAQNLRSLILSSPAPRFISFSERAHKLIRSTQPQALLKNVVREYGPNVKKSKFENDPALS